MKANPKSLRRLKDAAARARTATAQAPQQIDFLAGLFPAQHAFVTDPSRYKAALTTRQAGKTHGVCRLLLKTAGENPGSNCMYVGLTRVAAKRIFWSRLKREADKLTLRYRANETECVLYLENGSAIYVVGAETESDIAGYRGLILLLIVVDEAQDFPPFLMKFVQEVLDPTLNTTQGTMAMTGTPNSLCQGYFFEITTDPSKGYAVHRWVGANNPAAHQSEDDLDAIKAKNAWTEESPAFRREWRGEWVPSDEELVYSYAQVRNSWDGIYPPGERTSVLGLDIGHRDRTTFVVAAYTSQSPNLIYPEVAGFRGLLVDDIERKILELQKKYGIYTVVADMGGLGLMILETIKQRPSHINIIPAKKQDKLAAQRLMNTDFRLGKIKAIHGTPLTEEWSHLTVDAKTGEENKSQPNDYCDAALYAYRHCRPYLFQLPVVSTEDYGSMRIRTLLEQEAAEAKVNKRNKNLLFGGG